MRLTRQAALAIALVAGLLAALGAWIFIGQQQGKVQAPPPAEVVSLPMPIKTIPAWTELHPDMFQLQQVKKEQVPVNVITDLQGLEGRIAVSDLPEKQAVSVGQVAEKSKRLGIAYALNEGLRGMSVSLDVVGAVSDFVQPGNHVDVMCSFQQDGQVVVRTIVQDVTVLAMGQTTSVAPPVEAEGAAGQPAAPKAEAAPRRAETPVTLALTPTQAQIVLTADKAGDLRLALRPTDDRSIVPLPTANSWTMVGAIPAKASARPSAAAATPQPAAGQAAPAPTTTTAGGAVMAQQPGAVTVGPRPNKPYVEVIRGGVREYIVP